MFGGELAEVGGPGAFTRVGIVVEVVRERFGCRRRWWAAEDGAEEGRRHDCGGRLDECVRAMVKCSPD